MARNILCWGPAASRKSTFGLEEASETDPVSYHLFEPGGFHRAAIRLGLDEKDLPPWVRLHKYELPVTSMMSLGKIELTAGGRAKPNLYYRLDGFTDVLVDFNQNYMKDCNDGFRPITDTISELWDLQQDTIRQQLQDATDGDNADYLDQLRYGGANKRMFDAVHYARRKDLDACWVAHEKEKFVKNRAPDQPVEMIIDSWRKTEAQMDCVLYFRMVGESAVARISKGGEAGVLVGLDIPAPTLKKVTLILDNAALLINKRTGIPGLPIKDVNLLMDTERVGMLLAVAKNLREDGDEVPTELETLENLAKMRGLM